MKKTIKVIMTIVMMFTIALTGCKKEAGPKGDKGDKGDAGTNGTNGTNGVANIASYTLSAPAGSWTHIGTAGSPGDAYMALFTPSALNSSVISSGAVLLYMVGSNITQLPITVGTFGGNGTTSVYYEASVNFLAVYIADSDFFTPAPSSNFTFKLVVIPPAMRIAGVNYADYNEVKNAHNLKD